MDSHDQRVRAAVFDWLAGQVELHGDVLPRRLLEAGLMLGGERVPLLGPQGIWKPRILPSVPLSITTAPRGPYDDRIGERGLIAYRYRDSGPDHRDNAGLREAMRLQVPLVHFYGVVPGKYLATWPVFVVGDDREAHVFRVMADDVRHLALRPDDEPLVSDAQTEVRRAYVTSAVRQRLHQRAFRERVLEAYREQCALCRLRHEALLDAAHIVPDSEPDGDPTVPNGLALCKLHHAAFDRHFLTVRPDYVVEVRREILEEEDGPMLLHGLKGMHGAPIILPERKSLRPDPALLQRRYAKFLSAAP